MKNKIVVRAVIGLFAIAALYLLYQWFSGWTLDPDTGTTDTTDMIVAVEYTDEGDTLVLFDADGNKTVVPEHDDGTNDNEPVWRPDGQRIFFISTRENRSSAIFRWNVARNIVEEKSDGSRAASSLFFGPPDWPGLADSGLITLGGNVFEFNQRDKSTRQILPPTQFEGGGDPESAGSAYERIGTSFRVAKWGKDRKVIYAVMQGESSDVFIINYMQPMGEIPAGPVALYAGQSIQLDVGPDGTAVIAIQGFEFPDPANLPQEFVRNGVGLKPFRNALIAVRLNDDGTPAIIPIFNDQPELGIVPGTLSSENRQENGIPANISGVFVDDLAPNSAAERLGMQKGDVLVSINGKPMPTPEAMYAELQAVMVGGTADVTYYSTKSGAKGLKTAKHQFGTEVTVALRDPAISPDSRYVAATGGQVDGYNYTPADLVVLPIAPAGIQQRRRLVTGAIFSPHWHPSGDKLVYAKLGPANDSQIFTINADGSDEKNVSGPGDYGTPKFSPMVKGS